MAAVGHLGILKLKFLTANHFRDTFRVIITLNFVEVGHFGSIVVTHQSTGSS